MLTHAAARARLQSRAKGPGQGNSAMQIRHVSESTSGAGVGVECCLTLSDPHSERERIQNRGATLKSREGARGVQRAVYHDGLPHPTMTWLDVWR